MSPHMFFCFFVLFWFFFFSGVLEFSNLDTASLRTSYPQIFLNNNSNEYFSILYYLLYLSKETTYWSHKPHPHQLRWKASNQNPCFTWCGLAHTSVIIFIWDHLMLLSKTKSPNICLFHCCLNWLKLLHGSVGPCFSCL